MLCHTLKIAPGIAAAAPKCSMAREAASPEFCIPTSIATALALAISIRSALERANPIAYPSRLWQITTAMISSPVSLMRPALAATTPPTMRRMTVIDTSGNSFTMRRTNAPKNAFTAKPAAMGSITTLTIDSIMAVNDTSIHVPASCQVRNGVTMGARRVVVMVMDTERATSPRAR